jgi:bifunctional DNase/RNase
MSDVIGRTPFNGRNVMSKDDKEESAIEMFVGGVVVDPNTQSPVVILKDEHDKINLPIWVGMQEATGILSALKQLTLPRPQTHDFMYDVISALGASVLRIIITEVRETTYIAEMVCVAGDRTFIFDCRPSDAINIALRATASIYVATSVLEKARMVVEENASDAEGSSTTEDNEDSVDFQQIEKGRWNEILESLDPQDFKYRT